MNDNSQSARPVLFPVPENGSSLAPESLPSFPAFPVGQDGSWMYVAVPALVILPVGVFTEECQEISLADAVEILAKSEMTLSGVPVECKPLCESYPNGNIPTPGARARLLRLLMATAHAWVSEAARLSDDREAENVRKAGGEILALLSLFQPAGLGNSSSSMV